MFGRKTNGNDVIYVILNFKFLIRVVNKAIVIVSYNANLTGLLHDPRHFILDLVHGMVFDPEKDRLRYNELKFVFSGDGTRNCISLRLTTLIRNLKFKII